MTCKEEGCGGTVNTGVEKRVTLLVNCHTTRVASPCEKCGRLHWTGDGEMIFNRCGERAFLENEQIVHRPPVDCGRAQRLSNALRHGNDINAEAAVWLQEHISSCEGCRHLPCIV